MASKDLISSFNQRTTGDAAVDGLLAGLIAGIVMAVFLLVIGLISGESPALVLGRFDVQAAERPVAGLVTHVAISAIYGLIFGVLIIATGRIWSVLRRRIWLFGLVYGLLLFGIAVAAFSAGANSGLVQFAAWTLLLAHLIYGLVLGLVIQRKWGKEEAS